MQNKEKDWIDSLSASLDRAKVELSKADYLAESGGNAGIRKMNSNRAEWLHRVIYLAELGLEAEKLCMEQEATASVAATSVASEQPCAECICKDSIINDLQTINDQLRVRLHDLKETYDTEVNYRKELATRAKLDWCNDIISKAHERCWLDGNVLVCPVEFLDRCLLELIVE